MPLQHAVKRGDPFDPSCATVPLAPTTCSKRKKRKVRVLGMMRCENLANASELNLKEVGGRGSTSRVSVLSISPFGHKIRGVYPKAGRSKLRVVTLVFFGENYGKTNNYV